MNMISKFKFDYSSFDTTLRVGLLSQVGASATHCYLHHVFITPLKEGEIDL